MTLTAHGLSRSFGSVQAVNRMDIDLKGGTIVALVGPNGAGKTTLMLMLAGLLAPDTGTIEIDGVDMSSNPRTARSKVGWMPDTLGSWDSLTTKEILTTFAQAYGTPRKDALPRALELLSRTGLQEFANQPARVLSRGQKQRLSLARALVNSPSVLLLDEPAAGLDPRARLQLRDILREEADRGATVLVSSHVLSELETMVDDAIFVSKGLTVERQERQNAGSATFTVEGIATDDHLAQVIAAIEGLDLGLRVSDAKRSSLELEREYMALEDSNNE
ncbi:MAG: ABC transporter ATP-binding protein [Actinomycetaceae bacterium]|nr:ABC transporter ATP-binding protein [Actinomycetaceae bacterium]